MNRRNLAAVASLLATFCFFGDAYAQSREVRNRWSQAYVALNDGEGQMLRQTGRMISADVIKAYCERYWKQVPSLSPREQDWLQSELKIRVESAINTPEFARRRAGEFLETCAANIETIKSSKGTTREAVHWGVVASMLSKRDLYTYVARLNGTGGVRFSKDDLEDLELAPSLASLIVERILIPALSLGAEWGK